MLGEVSGISVEWNFNCVYRMEMFKFLLTSVELMISNVRCNEGLKMRRQWSGKNVDLMLLSDSIEDFLNHKGFKVVKDVSAEGYSIFAAPSRISDVREDVTVKVLGNSKDFVVDFLSSEKSRSSIQLGYITTVFGGGSLLLKGLKSREALETLEKEFWVYVEDLVLHLVNSIKKI